MLEKKKSLKSMTSFSPSESIRRAKQTQNRREKIVQIRLKKKINDMENKQTTGKV